MLTLPKNGSACSVFSIFCAMKRKVRKTEQLAQPPITAKDQC